MATIEQVQQAVRSQPRLRVRGAGTKPALCEGASLCLRDLSGVLEYEPGEYTITARAGTAVADLQDLLGEHGQYLPFDPPWVEAGATLGGTVAAGLSGPGRFRYGGVRDFLLGVRWINGEGELVCGGGKVVKNAAGFDLPKLMVGSLGEFGLLVEVTCKVFPRPLAWATLAVALADLARSVETLMDLARAPLDLFCVDLEPPSRLWLRLGGMPEAMPRHVDRVLSFLPAGSRVDRASDAEEHAVWRAAREFAWVPRDGRLVKIAIVPGNILELESRLLRLPGAVPRRYSVGGNVAWLAWPAELAAELLESMLRGLGRGGLALSGAWPDPRLGVHPGQAFARRLRQVLDPLGKFALGQMATY